MRRFLLGILWCLMFSSCSNPAVTTTTVPASPTPIPTVTVQPTNTALPSNILDRASLSGLSPEEIVFFYLEIRSYVESDDIGALANKIRFPLAICGLQHGDVIETKDEFIEKYGYAFGDEWKPFFLKSDLGRVTVHEYNIQASGINFSKIWNDDSRQSYKIWITGIGYYCYLDPIKVSNRATAEAATPEYSREDFIFGTYHVILHDSVGGTMLSQGEIDAVQTVVIEEDIFSSDATCHMGYACSCPNPGYEFNKPVTGKGTSEFYGLGSPIGQLIVVCNGIPNAYFDILANDQIGFYYDGNYWIFKHQ